MKLSTENIDRRNIEIKQKPLVKAAPAMRKTVGKTLRYPILLGERWGALPHSIQKRFVKWAQNRQVIIYQGRLLETRFSRLGIVLSKLCWLIGKPLPDVKNARGPSTVIVRECRKENAQIWTRIYPRDNNVPQVIQSIKRFEGETGLEEMVTKFIGMSLTLEAHHNRLSFISKNYFFKLGTMRFRIPSMLTPGHLCVSHKELGPNRFRFTLSIRHKFFGELIYQTAIYQEVEQ